MQLKKNSRFKFVDTNNCHARTFPSLFPFLDDFLFLLEKKKVSEYLSRRVIKKCKVWEKFDICSRFYLTVFASNVTLFPGWIA